MIAFNGKYFYKIYINKNYNKILLKNLKNNNLILEFYDYKIDNKISTFRRVINNQPYYFKNNELIVKILKRETNFLTIQFFY
jgi:hypothetical protein